MSISEDEQMLAAGYVLGDLSPAEIAEFEAAMADNPALQAEISALQAAFNQLPAGLDLIAPPANLKAKIVDDFDAATLTVDRQPEATVDRSLPKALPWGRIIAGIGLVIGGLLAFDNFSLRQQLQVAQQVNQQELASILNQPKSRLLTLSDRQERPVGKVLFTPGNWQQIVVSAQNLPPLPVDNVYRMWLELANGQILPCGEFVTDPNGRIFIKLNASQNPPTGIKAKGVFVTIDRHNAPLQPTGERIIQGTI